MLAELLREPQLAAVDIDGEDRITVHREILERKPLMKQVCRELYGHCARLDEKHFEGDGARIELGAGVSLLKEFFPDVLVSDVVPAPHLDIVLDAQDMREIADSSVRAFYGIHCFHHFPAPRLFFKELERTIVPGGGCVLIEPYFGAVAKIIYPKLFASEDFDMNQPEWEGGQSGAMNDANQALSYVVFFRDRAKFLSEFPSLSIAEAFPLTNYLRYMLSGGLNFRQVVPDLFAPLLRGLETGLSPLARFLALHHVIVLKKQQ